MFKPRSWLWILVGMGVILAAIWSYQAVILKSREANLQTNLATMRSVIKQYTADKRRAPQSLQDLVDAGYFRSLPLDPITNSRTSWKPVIEDSGITDLHSGSSSISSDGTTYSAW